jgi:hypothetical protein
MKNFLMILAILLMFTSCQEEYVQIDEPDMSKTISADDNIADLIYKIVLKDGSFDNIIDRCSEISIMFPYSIMLDDQLYNINSQEDIDVIMLDYFHLRDDIEINYPVTISYSDYLETVLYNEDELEQIQEQFNTDLIDDDIECIDFVYPIKLTLYNTEYQKTDFIVANNDYDIYNIFNEISGIIIEFDFPITVETRNGDIIVINNNFELESEITSVITNCDEDDDVDFEDDDFPFEDLITSHEWEVSFYSDTTDETSSFNSLILKFNSDYTIQVSGTETIYGTWELNIGVENVLEIEFDTDETPLIWLNDGWIIKNINTSILEMEAESDFDEFIKTLKLIKSE